MPDKSKPRILNVDDNTAGRYATGRVLQQAGFEVLDAATGREALRLAEELPDLVLLDVNLPDINGLEVCRQIKANPRTAGIPVVHLSATFVGGVDQAAGLTQRADGYLTHPLEPQVLVATVNAFLRLGAVEHALRESEDRIRRKLDVILLPEGDIGTLELADVIDTAEIQYILDDFFRITHFSTTVIDRHGNILVAAGWQDICTKFHRVHPITCEHCLESDVMLSARVEQGVVDTYKCRSNMWHVATPIVVGETYMGKLLLNQFFFKDESLDYDASRAQAQDYGFDEEEYLAALDRVPRWSREEVNAAMAFCTRFVNLISKLGYSRIKLSRTLSEHERMEEFLRQSNEKLEQYTAAMEKSKHLAEAANLAKSEFMANMSHELRTPLNAVIGFSDGLLERTNIHPLNEHQKDRLGRIKTSGEHLLQLINKVLDLAKAESGKTELEITTFDVEPMVQKVGDMMESLIKDNLAVRFTLDLEEHLPPITSDCGKIQQILVNLLGNAVKFTEQGSITLRVHHNNDSFLFSVEDTGEGIAAEHLNRVFGEFYQIERKTHRTPRGTGLGLAISKAFATRLGGTLTVESVQGQGSTFTLAVPLVLDRRKDVDRHQVVPAPPQPTELHPRNERTDHVQ